jgi:hypothetical protein
LKKFRGPLHFLTGGSRFAIGYPTAYVASLCQTQSLVSQILTNAPFQWGVNTPLRMLRISASLPDVSFEALLSEENTQKCLSAAIDNHRQSTLLSNATDDRTQARLHSLTLPFSGTW